MFRVLTCLAVEHDLTLREAALQHGVSEELFDRVVVPAKLTHPGTADLTASPAGSR